MNIMSSSDGDVPIFSHISDRNGINRSRINQAQALQLLGFERRALTMLIDVRSCPVNYL